MEIIHFLFCFFFVFFFTFFFPVFFFLFFFSVFFFTFFFSCFFSCFFFRRPPPHRVVQCSPHCSYMYLYCDCKRDGTPRCDDISVRIPDSAPPKLFFLRGFTLTIVRFTPDRPTKVPPTQRPIKFRDRVCIGSSVPAVLNNILSPEPPMHRVTPLTGTRKNNSTNVSPGYNILSTLPNIGDFSNEMVSSGRKCHLLALPGSIDIEPETQGEPSRPVNYSNPDYSNIYKHVFLLLNQQTPSSPTIANTTFHRSPARPPHHSRTRAAL